MKKLCKHYDTEFECCSKLTDWSHAMVSFVPCVHSTFGPCEMFEEKELTCWWCQSYKIDHSLTPDTDFHSGVIGEHEPTFDLMYSCGFHDGPRIELRHWSDKINMWQIVGKYYPKFCPECGRKIDEWSSNNDKKNSDM